SCELIARSCKSFAVGTMPVVMPACFLCYIFPAANGTRTYDDTLYAVPGTHGAGHAPCPRGRLSGYGNRRPQTAQLLGADRAFAHGLQTELHARHPGVEKPDAGK